MPTSAAGSSRHPQPPAPRRLVWRAGGFTLLELLVVLAIIAMATAGVSLALRDSSHTRLEREGQRLAALLEAARARSRVTGVPVRWRITPEGFVFEGLPSTAQQDSLPERWLNADTRAVAAQPLVLGPEPIIGAQAVELASLGPDGAHLRVATDGVRPFAVRPLDAAAP